MLYLAQNTPRSGVLSKLSAKISVESDSNFGSDNKKNKFYSQVNQVIDKLGL